MFLSVVRQTAMAYTPTQSTVAVVSHSGRDWRQSLRTYRCVLVVPHVGELLVVDFVSSRIEEAPSRQ